MQHFRYRKTKQIRIIGFSFGDDDFVDFISEKLNQKIKKKKIEERKEKIQEVKS